MAIEAGKPLSDGLVKLIRKQTSTKDRNLAAMEFGFSGGNSIGHLLIDENRGKVTAKTKPVVERLLKIAIEGHDGDMVAVMELKESELAVAEKGAAA